MADAKVSCTRPGRSKGRSMERPVLRLTPMIMSCSLVGMPSATRSEEHTSELQSQSNLVCRLLLEKKKKTTSAQYRLSNHRLQRVRSKNQRSYHCNTEYFAS